MNERLRKIIGIALFIFAIVLAFDYRAYSLLTSDSGQTMGVQTFIALEILISLSAVFVATVAGIMISHEKKKEVVD